MLRAQNPAIVDTPRGSCSKTPREARGFAEAPRLRPHISYFSSLIIFIKIKNDQGTT